MPSVIIHPAPPDQHPGGVDLSGHVVVNPTNVGQDVPLDERVQAQGHACVRAHQGE
jgi:hypothetical protein